MPKKKIEAEMVSSNEWHFFLGDTVWVPIEDKCGEWELITMLDGGCERKLFEETYKIGGQR